MLLRGNEKKNCHHVRFFRRTAGHILFDYKKNEEMYMYIYKVKQSHYRPGQAQSVPEC